MSPAEAPPRGKVDAAPEPPAAGGMSTLPSPPGAAIPEPSRPARMRSVLPAVRFLAGPVALTVAWGSVLLLRPAWGFPALLVAAFLGAIWSNARDSRRRGPALAGAPVVAVRWTTAGKAAFSLAAGFATSSLLLANPALQTLAFLLFACSLAPAALVRSNLGRVRLLRTLDPRPRVGAPALLAYRAENAGPRPAVGIEVRDALWVGATPGSLEVAFGAVPARGSASASTHLVFRRRGRRRLRSAVLRTRFPMGLFEAVVDSGGTAEALVRPREGRLTGALVARLAGQAATTSRMRTLHPGSDHFHGLREFRDGDDPRRIHWRTTARRGVRTYVEWRAEEARSVVVVLGCVPRGAPASDACFERAVSTAATVLRACVRTGIPARLAVGAADAGGASGLRVRGRAGLEAALDALALVRGRGRTPESSTIDLLAGRHGPTLVWIDPIRDPSREDRVRALARARGAGAYLHADDPAYARYVKGLP